MAAQTAVGMRENSFRRKFDNYLRGNPLAADPRRKAYAAIAAKLARVIFGLSSTTPFAQVPSGRLRPRR